MTSTKERKDDDDVCMHRDRDIAFQLDPIIDRGFSVLVKFV